MDLISIRPPTTFVERVNNEVPTIKNASVPSKKISR